MNCSVVLGGFRKNATFFHLQCLTAGSTGLDSAGGGAAASSSDKGSGTRSSATLRSEEHTSELQSQSNLVCRLLLEKKKKRTHVITIMGARNNLHTWTAYSPE